MISGKPFPTFFEDNFSIRTLVRNRLALSSHKLTINILMVIQKLQAAIGVNFSLEVSFYNVTPRVFSPNLISTLMVMKACCFANLTVNRIYFSTKNTIVVIHKHSNA